MQQDDQKLRAALASWLEAPSRSGSSHPDVATLLAYRADELTVSAARKLTDHLLVCRSCQDLLLAASDFSRLDSPPAEKLPVLAIHAAWSGFKMPGGKAIANDAIASPSGQWILAVAAVLALTVVGLTLCAGSLQRSLTRLPAAQPDTPILDLRIGAGTRQLDRAPTRFGVPAASDLVVFILTPPEEPPFPQYELRLAVAGETAWRSPIILTPNDAGSLTVAIPRSLLPDGVHRIELRGRGDSQVLGEHTVEIETLGKETTCFGRRP